MTRWGIVGFGGLLVIAYLGYAVWGPVGIATLTLMRAILSPPADRLPVGRETLAVHTLQVDHWIPLEADPFSGCLLVIHGLTPEGKDDPRLQTLARAVAWTGVDVYVPHVPALATFQLDPALIPTLQHLYRFMERQCPGWVLMGISVGAGPAVGALWASPQAWPRLRGLVLFGAYADACRLITWGLPRGRQGDNSLAWAQAAIVRALRQWGRAHGWSAHQIQVQIKRLLRCRSEEEVWAWCRQVPTDLRAYLSAVSPIRRIPPQWEVPTWILHSPRDPLIPFEESQRLYQAMRGAPVRLITLPTFAHVEAAGDHVGWSRSIWGFLQTVASFYTTVR